MLVIIHEFTLIGPYGRRELSSGSQSHINNSELLSRCSFNMMPIQRVHTHTYIHIHTPYIYAYYILHTYTCTYIHTYSAYPFSGYTHTYIHTYIHSYSLHTYIRTYIQVNKVFVISALWDYNYHHFVVDSLGTAYINIHTTYIKYRHTLMCECLYVCMYEYEMN